MAEPTNYLPDPMPDTYEENSGLANTFGTLSVVTEVDGSPSISNVSTIRFSNGSVTDDGGGQVTVTSGGGSGVGNIAPGVVDPEGVVTASAGATYFNSNNSTFWQKATGAGNTGWVQLI